MSEQKPRFTLRVGEIFKSLEKGLKEIEENLAASRKARLSNLTDELLLRLIPSTASYQTHAEVFWKDEVQKQRVCVGKDWTFAEASAPLTSLWFQEFIGERLHMGEVLTPTGLWHILYRDDGEVRRIMSNTDTKCNPCIWKKNFMMRFEGPQLYASVYDRIEGLKKIREAASKGAVFRATVVPPYLLKDIIPPAKKGDYRFIMSRRDPLAKFFQEDSDVRYASRAKIYYVYGEEESSVGSLRIDGDYYTIFWRGNDVFSVMKIDNRVCANCLSRVFDTAWKYSEKV
jgi:hypothetical protein